jgi:hypothetical protein
MSCNIVTYIPGSQCIGDSLETINNNFDKLETVVCSLSTAGFVPVTTDTIAPTFNTTTREFASNVRDLSITSGKLGNGSVIADKIGTNAVTTAKLSAGAVTTDKIAENTITYSRLASAQGTIQEQVQPRLAKAWVNFDGFAGVGLLAPADVRQSFNVSSVTKTASGRWQVNLINPISLNSPVFASACSPGVVPGEYREEYDHITQGYVYSSTRIDIVNLHLDATAPNFGLPSNDTNINVIVFGN